MCMRKMGILKPNITCGFPSRGPVATQVVCVYRGKYTVVLWADAAVLGFNLADIYCLSPLLSSSFPYLLKVSNSKKS